MTMQKTIWTQTLSKFTSDITSSEPTPGGGSVALVSGVLGTSLIIMALEISRDGENKVITELIAQLKKYSSKLSKYADSDIEVFENYMKTLRLPKNSEIEILERKKLLYEASIQATEVPIESAIIIKKIIELAERSLPYIKKNIISDVGAGSHLLNGSLKSVLLSVDINTSNFKEQSIKEKYISIREDIEFSFMECYTRIINYVHDILK